VLCQGILEHQEEKNNMKKKMISEYGGKEKYPSMAAKAKHEKKEGPKVEKKESMMWSKKKK